MKVAVTGATGFVGRAVVSELLQRSLRPTLVVRPGSEPSDLPTVELDLSRKHHWAALGSPDVLLHLAWGGLPNYRSRHHFERELPMHYNFLRALVATGLPRLLVTGTCFEYGMQSGPLSENLESRPSNPYGFAKDTLRRQLEFLGQDHPFTLLWARLFYLHGPGQASGSLYPLLKRSVENGEQVFPMSGGEQLRDFLPIEEAARLLVSLALSTEGGIVNICSGRPTSVRTLVEGWLKSHGWSITLDLGRIPYPDYEPMAFWGDRSRLNRMLELL